jgi:hypothetical protein
MVRQTPAEIKGTRERPMPDGESVSTEDLRKAILNVADAIRLTAEALELMRGNLSLTNAAVGLNPFLQHFHRTLVAANGRLSAAVDLLVKEDVEHSA